MTPTDDFEALVAWLRATVYDRTGYRMSIESIKAALLHIPGIESLAMQYGGGGTDNIYSLRGVKVAVPAKASVEEAVAAIAAAVPKPAPVAPSVATQFLNAAYAAATPAPAPLTPGKSMSITGLDSGAFSAVLANLKAKVADAKAQGAAKVEAAGVAAVAQVGSAVADLTSRIDAEVQTALGELTTGGNGGPA